MSRLILVTLVSVTSYSGALAEEFGLATYYENIYHRGLIAAHPTLPFRTQVRVHNLNNGRDVVVTIVDRGPYAAGRIIDVSTVAARALGMIRSGVASVRLEILPSGKPGLASCAGFIPQSNRRSGPHRQDKACAPVVVAVDRRGPE